MDLQIRPFQEADASQAASIWNQVVTDGMAFPQTETMTTQEAIAFFRRQSYTGIAWDCDTGSPVGLYILHPNNVGRCGHIGNASYAVRADVRGRHIGEALVTHCLEKARELGFRLMQFNAVVASNYAAQHLYEKLGFVRVGSIPGGFLVKGGGYQDIILYYYQL